MRPQRKSSRQGLLGWLSVLLLVAFAWPTVEAKAQAIGDALSVAEIKQCLCQKQQIDQLRHDLLLAQSMLEEREAELTGLHNQVEQQRANTSRADSVGQQLLKDMMAQERDVRELLQSSLVPDYNAQVE